MARLPRLSVPGLPHLVAQRGHNGGAIVVDDNDLDALLQCLREAARSHGVVLHAYAVTASTVALLATPDSAQGIGRMMQALGRRHAAAFNRRHGRSGALWDGRYRSALVEPGAVAFEAMRWLDGASLPVPHAVAEAYDESGASPHEGHAPLALARTSAVHRTSGRRDAALVDLPAYWHLGNTPFDREQRYRTLLHEGLPAARALQVEQALHGGWALGSAAFLAELATRAARPVAPRPRGRPRRSG